MDNSYHGKTVMRDAFERLPAEWSPLAKRIFDRLKTKSGTFRAAGWGVIR